jgi:hypothetical protein
MRGLRWGGRAQAAEAEGRMMRRDDFLRSALLAPLAALFGCKRKAPPIHLETSDPTVPSRIAATAWTISTTGGSATLWVNAQDGSWVEMTDNSGNVTYTGLSR